MSDSSQQLFQEISKLRWHCRRGVKELDIVLSKYLDQHYEMANDNEKLAFKELLDFEDPILFAMLMENVEPANNEHLVLLEKLRNLFS